MTTALWEVAAAIDFMVAKAMISLEALKEMTTYMAAKEMTRSTQDKTTMTSGPAQATTMSEVKQVMM